VQQSNTGVSWSTHEKGPIPHGSEKLSSAERGDGGKKLTSNSKGWRPGEKRHGDKNSPMPAHLSKVYDRARGRTALQTACKYLGETTSRGGEAKKKAGGCSDREAAQSIKRAGDLVRERTPYIKGTETEKVFRERLQVQGKERCGNLYWYQGPASSATLTKAGRGEPRVAYKTKKGFVGGFVEVRKRVSRPRTTTTGVVKLKRHIRPSDFQNGMRGTKEGE